MLSAMGFEQPSQEQQHECMMDFQTQTPRDTSLNVYLQCGNESVCVGTAPNYLTRAEYFKAKLEFEHPVDGQIFVQVPDAEHVRPAVHLIQYLRTGKLHDEVRSDQTALMIMAGQAQYYGVPGLLDDVLCSLCNCLQHQPRWCTCLYVVLPDVTDQLSQSAAYPQLRNLAVQHMQRRLGDDLEVILASSSKARKLASLPFDLFLSLLSSHETKAAYESTVVCAITCWLASQPVGSVTSEQIKQLVSCVRVRGLPKRYCQQVLPLLGWCTDVAGPAFAGQASIWLDAVEAAKQEYADIAKSRRTSCGSSSPPADKEEVLFIRHAVERHLGEAMLERCAQQRWLLLLREPRAPSAVQCLEMTCSLLPELITAQLQAHSISWQSSMCTTFGGIHWQLAWRVHPVSHPQRGKVFSMSWAMQVGVVYRIPGIDPGHQVLLELPTPVLHHPAACLPPSAGVTTRRQLMEQGGYREQFLQPLPMGHVKLCEEVLLLVPCPVDKGSASEVKQALQPLLDDAGMLQLRVTGMEVIA